MGDGYVLEVGEVGENGKGYGKGEEWGREKKRYGVNRGDSGV